MPRKVKFEVTLPETQARALARFVSQTGISECERNAADTIQAELMHCGLQAVKDGLQKRGITPR